MKKHGRITRWALLTLLLLTGCADSRQKAEDSAAAEKQLPWKGVTLRLVVADDGPLAEAVRRLQGEWEASTGAQLEVAEATQEALLAEQPPAADAMIYPAYLVGMLAERDRLRPLPDKALSSAEMAWAEVFETDKTFDADWGAETYAVPFGSPVFVCLYRQDLLEKLGRKPPRTWPEYRELAELLADRAKLGDAAPTPDRPWSGTMEPLAAGWAGLTLLARAAAYVKHRNHFSALFDMETMDPLIAGAPFVKALDELAAAKQDFPEEAFDASPEQVHEAFVSGRCAMALTWTSAAWDVGERDGLAEDAAREALEVGCIELPGSAQAFNPKTQHWDARRGDETPHVPLVGISGRAGSITAQSEHADAAFQLLAWLSGPQWSQRVSTASAATTVFRRSQVDASTDWADRRLGPAGALAYAETVERSLSSADSFGAPRIEGRDRYLAALDSAVRDAVAGKVSSNEALQRAADEWRKITEEFSFERQRSSYRRSLGLR